MSDDLTSRLSEAAPADLDRDSMEALLGRVRAKVDDERRGSPPARVRRLRPRTRLAVVAAAAAVITAVPVVISVVGQDDGDTPSLPAAVAVAQNGEFSCANGYATAVDPAEAEVRLLPDELPAGWGYTQIFVRHERSLNCDAQSLVALRLDPGGVVTGRLAVSGPVDAYVDGPVVDRDSVPDTVFGAPARRFDLLPDPEQYIDHEVHRWVWTDAAGRQWSAAVVGFGLEEARRQLTGVTIDGSALGWEAVDPAWELIHLRTGDPYDVPSGGTIWSVAATGGLEGRGFDVYSNPEPHLPVAAEASIGDRLTDLDGRSAVVSPARGGEADGGAPGSPALITLAVNVGPGIAAFSRFPAEDLDAVRRMLASLRQVPPDDPRIREFGER